VQRVSARSAARRRRRGGRQLARGEGLTAIRDDALERLATEQFDVVVIGGGITGAGVALDASARGLKVALVERRDLASGTSSRSSRQVHGGIRYLAHGEIGLVRESLAERSWLASAAPHLVRPLPILLVPPSIRLRAALTLYDLLGAGRYRGRHRRTDAGFAYWEAQVDDARLTLAVARTAARRYAAVVATYLPVTALEPGRVYCGDLAVRTRTVVNAAGVWSDEVRALADPGASPQLRPARGVHVVVPRELLPGDEGLIRPRREGGFVFTAPWGSVVIVGTTDSAHDGPLDDPVPSESEIEELLDAVGSIARPDVVAAYAGLRPLVAHAGDTRDLSRRHSVTESGGVVTVTGGKLTTFRRMAEDAVDALAETLGPLPPCNTRSLRLDGALDEPRTHLERRYGTEAEAVLALARTESLESPLLPGLPYIEAEVAWAARHEWAHTVDDVLERRTRATTELRDVSAARPRVAELLRGVPVG
jgi:glycerol-3-phosphate dehydrogenase